MTNPLFLDTTIQIDRVLKEQPPALAAALQSLLAQFDYLVTCGVRGGGDNELCDHELQREPSPLPTDGTDDAATVRSSEVPERLNAACLLSPCRWVVAVDKVMVVTN